MGGKRIVTWFTKRLRGKRRKPKRTTKKSPSQERLLEPSQNAISSSQSTEKHCAPPTPRGKGSNSRCTNKKSQPGRHGTSGHSPSGNGYTALTPLSRGLRKYDRTNKKSPSQEWLLSPSQDDTSDEEADETASHGKGRKAVPTNKKSPSQEWLLSPSQDDTSDKEADETASRGKGRKPGCTNKKSPSQECVLEPDHDISERSSPEMCRVVAEHGEERKAECTCTIKKSPSVEFLLEPVHDTIRPSSPVMCRGCNAITQHDEETKAGCTIKKSECFQIFKPDHDIIELPVMCHAIAQCDNTTSLSLECTIEPADQSSSGFDAITQDVQEAQHLEGHPVLSEQPNTPLPEKNSPALATTCEIKTSVSLDEVVDVSTTTADSETSLLVKNSHYKRAMADWEDTLRRMTGADDTNGHKLSGICVSTLHSDLLTTSMSTHTVGSDVPSLPKVSKPTHLRKVTGKKVCTSYIIH